MRENACAMAPPLSSQRKGTETSRAEGRAAVNAMTRAALRLLLAVLELKRLNAVFATRRPRGLRMRSDMAANLMVASGNWS